MLNTMPRSEIWSTSSLSLPTQLFSSSNAIKSPTTPHHHFHPSLPLFFFLIFPGGENPYLVFPFGSSLRVRLSNKAQAAARVGRSGISDGCFTAPEESAGRTPQLLSKGNIVLIRNRRRLCTFSAVLIYLGLNWYSVALNKIIDVFAAF